MHSKYGYHRPAVSVMKILIAVCKRMVQRSGLALLSFLSFVSLCQISKKQYWDTVIIKDNKNYYKYTEAKTDCYEMDLDGINYTS